MCHVSKSGLPTRVILDEATHKVGKATMIGVTKAVVLNADEHCPSAIVFSVSDQKLVCFLSTVMDSISWEICSKNTRCESQKKSQSCLSSN